MELKDFLSILKRQWAVILATSATLFALWFLFSMFNEKNTYRASAKAISTPSIMQLTQFIGVDVSRFISPAIYVDLPKGESVLSGAKRSLELQYPDMTVGEIDESITVETKEQKYLFTITARSDHPQKAVDMANAVATALKDHLKEYSTKHLQKVIDQKQTEVRKIRLEKELKERDKLEEIKRAEGVTEDVTQEKRKGLQELVEDLTQKQILFKGQVDGIEARIEATKQRKEEISSNEFIPDVEIPPTEMFKDLQVKLSQLKIQLVETRIRYTEAHPVIKDIHNRDTYYRDLLVQELKKMEESRPQYVQKRKQQLLIENERYKTTLEEEKSSRFREMENIVKTLDDLKIKSDKWDKVLRQKAEVDRVLTVIGEYESKIKEWTDKKEAMPDLIEVESPAKSAPPEGKKSRQMMPMMAILALILGIGVGFLRDYLDDRIKTSFEIKKYLNWPVIGVVPLVKKQDEVILHQAAIKSPLMDIYSRIGILMDTLTQKKGCKVYMLTSTKPQEGKTTMASNLAIAAARLGKKIALVDCDLRHPSIHKIFRIDNSTGVSTYLSGKLEARSELQKISEMPIVIADTEQPVVETAHLEGPQPAGEEEAPRPANGGLSDIIFEGNVEGLHLLPCGPAPSNPLSLLESANFKNMLGRLRDRFDIVVLDTPPLESTTDPLVVSRHVDATVVVVSCWDTKKFELTWAKRTLADIGANVIGVILNRSTLPSRSYYYYYYDHKSQTERV